MQQIPVMIISGFLGSGKTTLLLRLMKDARDRGLRFAVLMNELGRADVDGSLIRSEDSGIALEKLFDGCICCDKKSEIAQSLLQLLATQPDVIFIELTGVANPEEIADSLTEPRLRHHVALKRIITVLDTELTLEYNSIFSSDKQLVHTLRRQMETADVILLNKADRVSRGTADKVLKVVRKHNDRATTAISSFSNVDTDLLLKDVERRIAPAEAPALPRFRVRPASGTAVRKAEHHHHTEHQRSYTRLQTLCLDGEGAGVIPKRQLEQFIRQIGKSLIRAKGYIQVEKNGPLLLYQLAGKQERWEPADYTGLPYLVLIGIDLDEWTIRRMWEYLQYQ